ncbi:MAG TPA: hypothetical protein VNK49_00660 [Anaerolineales bacterium]|nr:hypothetical protein [Anaerolineales bacterium]
MLSIIMVNMSLRYRKDIYWVFLSALAVVAMILGWANTYRYGAGMASDSIKYLAVAENLLAGNGLFDHRGSPLLSWPPLYSMILAGLGLLTGLDVFLLGWHLNILLLGVNLFLCGVIFRRAFVEKPHYAYPAVLFVLLSLSALRIHVVISTDPLYHTMVLAFVLAAERYIRGKSYGAYAWMLVLSALAPLLRYVGLALAITAGIVILVENRKSMRVFWRDGLILGVSSILPIGWWLVVHNVIMYGSLWGLESQPVDVGANFSLGTTKILHWFVPYLSFLMPMMTRPWIPLVVAGLILVWLNRHRAVAWKEWLRSFASASVYPAMIHGVVYFLAVSLTALTADHRDLFSDRYYFILLVPVVFLVAFTLDKLIFPHLRFSPRIAWIAGRVALACWFIYPVYSMSEYLIKSAGVPIIYNIFNRAYFREMPAVAEMQRIREEQPEAVFYSNYVDAVWFYTRKPVSLLPLANVPDPVAAYAGWPHDKPGYLVWFEPNEYKHYLSPQQIAEFASLELIFEGENGKIYYVRPR